MKKLLDFDEVLSAIINEPNFLHLIYRIQTMKAKEGIEMNQNNWVAVKDGNPKKYGFFLVTVAGAQKNKVLTAYYGGGVWSKDGVIAWMPLPQEYKEEDN